MNMVKGALRRHGALAPAPVAIIAFCLTACGPQSARLPGATATPTRPAATETAIAVTGTAIAASQTAVAATQIVLIGPTLTAIAARQGAIAGTQTVTVRATPTGPDFPQTRVALTTIPPTLGPAGTIAPRTLPETGFEPGVHTVLSPKPAHLAYQSLQDLWLEIPRLGVRSPIVAVPPTANGWDVSRLSSQVGWLEGTAFPTWAGNSVMTAHLYGANGSPGPFVVLSLLSYGDRFVVHAGGQQYVYEVRATSTVSPDSVASVIADETLPWITLMTCKEYDPATQAYKFRTIVKAVQVGVN